MNDWRCWSGFHSLPVCHFRYLQLLQASCIRFALHLLPAHTIIIKFWHVNKEICSAKERDIKFRKPSVGAVDVCVSGLSVTVLGGDGDQSDHDGSIPQPRQKLKCSTSSSKRRVIIPSWNWPGISVVVDLVLLLLVLLVRSCILFCSLSPSPLVCLCGITSPA